MATKSIAQWLGSSAKGLFSRLAIQVQDSVLLKSFPKSWPLILKLFLPDSSKLQLQLLTSSLRWFQTATAWEKIESDSVLANELQLIQLLKWYLCLNAFATVPLRRFARDSLVESSSPNNFQESLAETLYMPLTQPSAQVGLTRQNSFQVNSNAQVILRSPAFSRWIHSLHSVAAFSRLPSVIERSSRSE